MTTEALETRLNDFDPEVRSSTLRTLVAQMPPPASTPLFNLHLHSFFSYNALGWSPSRIAWEAYRRGWYAVGMCDFDVLDGRQEFLDACTLLGLRGLVNLETRAFFDLFADLEIDSPGEPGVSYVLGCGFAHPLTEGSPETALLQRLRRMAADRNRALTERINAALPEIGIDYDAEVLHRSPSGTPTERHIVAAYIDKSEQAFPTLPRRRAFWALILEMDLDPTDALLSNRPAFENAVRNRLAKRGGLGYVQPSAATFPPLATFFAWVRACGAVPMESWLDGTSLGERDARALLDASQARGAAALNLIPDRNWNVQDAAERQIKLQNLSEIVAAAKERGMPLHIGTEMNRLGQPLVDDLEGTPLRAFREEFFRGAQILCGHMALTRFACFGYASEEAEAEFGDDLERCNAFFASVGALPAVTQPVADWLWSMGEDRALRAIRDAAKRGSWPEA